MTRAVFWFVLLLAAATCQGFDKDEFKSKCEKVRQYFPGVRFILKKVMVCRDVYVTAKDSEAFVNNLYDITKEEIVVFEGGDVGVVNSNFFKQFPFTKEMIFEKVSMSLESSEKLSLHAHMEMLSIISSRVTRNLESNAFHGLPNLKIFVLTDSHLEHTTIDSHLLKMNQKLEDLTLSDSAVHPPVDHIMILKNVEENAFDNLVNLKKLYFSIHNVKKPYAKLYKNKRLKEVLLQGYFDKFPADLPETIEELDISFVKFNTITKNDFKGLKNLRKLSMYHGDLKSVDLDAFDELGNLEYVTLNNNLIELFSYAHVKNCNKIKYLALSGNPIKSDLDFSALGLKEDEPLQFKKKFWGLF